MGPAHFRVLRERLGLTAEALGALLEQRVTDRTIRRWEAGKIPIPVDAIDTLLRLDDEAEQMVDRALNLVHNMAESGCGDGPDSMRLVVYLTDADLARAHPELVGWGCQGHRAMIGRVREALVREVPEVEIVGFDAEDYDGWRGDRADTPAMRAEWAQLCR